jgi:hypothetical protein
MNTPNAAHPQIEPLTGTIRVVGGARLDAAPGAAMLPSPSRPARGREGEHLLVLVDLTGPASPHLYRELREVVGRVYWSTTGSITAALRQVAVAANRHLFQFNLRAAPSDRCYGGLVCAVLHGDDLFVLQAGPAQACVFHRGRPDCFFGDEKLPHLGMGTLADVRLHHAFTTIGDTLLLASPTLAQAAGDAGLARVLPRAGMEETLAGLEQVGAGADFVALVARLAVQPMVPQVEAPAGRAAPPLRRPGILARLRRERGSTELAEVPVKPRVRPPRRVPAAPARRLGPSLGERMKEGLRSVGRGITAAGVWLAGGAGALFRRMLPGPEQQARRWARRSRPVPKENRKIMMAVAVSIPVLLAMIVALAYNTFGREERFQSIIEQAKKEIALAEVTGDAGEEARYHWEAALEYAGKALKEQPGHEEAAALQAQAQASLDALDGVVRLAPVQLRDLGKGTGLLRQLVVHGQTMFVLDPAAGWVVQLTLSPTADSVIEQEVPPPLVKTGQQIDERSVGKLVDFAWVGPGGERQSSSLVILEEGGVLVSYDPAWESEEGGHQLMRSFLGTPPTGTPKAVGSYEGRFYILDVGDNQILRYEPRGDTYPEQPSRYFVTSPPKSLETALDMAIDGSIYILYDDGTILKFLGGEPQPFEMRGLPDGMGQAVALTADPDGNSDRVYVADLGNERYATDRGNGRIVVLGPDGTFQAQLCAKGAFDALEALAVDEAAGRLYVFSGGWLYVAPLPPLP